MIVIGFLRPWPTRPGSQAPATDAGTYRAADGMLVHVRARTDGQLVAESERPWPTRFDPARLVKLSDDPCWPDLDPRTVTPSFD